MKRIIIFLFLFIFINILLYGVENKKIAGANITSSAKTTYKNKKLYLWQKAQNLFREGLKLERQRKYKKAFYKYLKVLKINKKYYPAYKHIGNCYLAFKNYKYAIKSYKMYLKYKKDKRLEKYIEQIENFYKKKEEKKLSQNISPYELKSPASSLMFSHIDLLIPVFMGYGNFYARSRNQPWTPVSTSLSIFSDLSFFSSLVILYNMEVVGDYKKIVNTLYAVSRGFAAYSLLHDIVSSPFIATENSIKFIQYIKHNNMLIEKKKVDYKDPVFTAAVSLVGGSIIPGAGHFYAGDNKTGLILLITTPLLTLTTAGIFSQLTEDTTFITLTTSSVYFIFRLIDLYGSLLHSDKVNTEYYKQLLCPNSPYRQNIKKEEKSVELAFALSLIPIGGSGNFYSENYWTAGTLLWMSVTGLTMYFLNEDDYEKNPTGTIMKYAGLSLYGLSCLYDIASAAGNAAIYNAIYTDKYDNLKVDIKVNPFLNDTTAGVMLSYNF